MVSTESAQPVLFRAGISSETVLCKKYIFPHRTSLCNIFEGQVEKLANLNGIDGTHLGKSIRASQTRLWGWVERILVPRLEPVGMERAGGER